MRDFDFLDNLDITGTVTHERKQRLQEGMNEFIDYSLDRENTLKEVKKNQYETFKEEIFMAADTMFGEENYEEILSEDTISLNESTSDLFVDVLCETVLKSLNIREDLVEDNREEICAKVKGLYEAFAEDINLEASDVVYEMVEKCHECATTFNIDAHDALYAEAAEIAMVIKEKVAQVIQEEKCLSQLEIMKEETGDYSCSVDIKLTLFKEMEMENVKQALTIHAENTELDKDDIILMSFYETVVDYTILETFNTLKMIDFNKTMYNHVSRNDLIDLGF